jgi:hypothetical protein
MRPVLCGKRRDQGIILGRSNAGWLVVFWSLELVHALESANACYALCDLRLEYPLIRALTTCPGAVLVTRFNLPPGPSCKWAPLPTVAPINHFQGICL